MGADRGVVPAGAGATGAGRLAPLFRPLAAFAASRAVVLVAMWIATKLQPELSLAEAASAWDGGWYLLAAEAGYPDAVPDGASTIAFFPLYPLLVRLVDGLPGLTPIAAALVVAGASAAAATVVLWLLTRQLWDGDVADRVVVLFAFSPGSFVLSMVYAEGTMLLLAAGCLWALVARRWLVAGVLAALGTASRPNAIALVGACAWASAVAVLHRREWRSLIAPLLAPAGIVAYFGFLWARTGVATAWFDVQRAGWEERVVPLAVVDDLRQLLDAPFADVNNSLAVAGTVLAVAGLVLLLRTRVPGEVVVYAVIVLGLALVSETLGPRPRFLLTAFPVLFAVALRVRSTGLAIAVGASACTLGALTVLSTATLLATP